MKIRQPSNPSVHFTPGHTLEMGPCGSMSVPSLWWAPQTPICDVNVYPHLEAAEMTTNTPFVTALGCLEHLPMICPHFCISTGQWGRSEVTGSQPPRTGHFTPARPRIGMGESDHTDAKSAWDICPPVPGWPVPLNETLERS